MDLFSTSSGAYKRGVVFLAVSSSVVFYRNTDTLMVSSLLSFRFLSVAVSGYIYVYHCMPKVCNDCSPTKPCDINYSKGTLLYRIFVKIMTIIIDKSVNVSFRCIFI